MTGSGCSCQHSVLSPEDPSLELVQRQADTINPLCPWTVNTGGSISVHPLPPPPPHHLLWIVASRRKTVEAAGLTTRFVGSARPRAICDREALHGYRLGRQSEVMQKGHLFWGDIVVALHHSSFAIALFIAQHCQGSRSCFQPEERCVVDRCDRCPWGFHCLESHFLPDALGDFITQNTSILWLNLTMNQVFFRYFYAMVLQTTNRSNN